MKYDLMVRSRPSGDIAEKHKQVTSTLSTIFSSWGLKEAVWPPVKDPGTWPMIQVTLTRNLPKGMKGLVSYQNRKYFRDEGKFDDYLKFEFDPERIDYASLVCRDFERIVDGMNAYRGHIRDTEFVHIDFDSARTIDGREGVFRINPVNFFDGELCKRAFQSTLDELLERLSGNVEKLSLTNGGILVIATSQIISLQDAEVLNNKLLQLFKTKSARK